MRILKISLDTNTSINLSSPSYLKKKKKQASSKPIYQNEPHRFGSRNFGPFLSHREENTKNQSLGISLRTLKINTHFQYFKRIVDHRRDILQILFASVCKLSKWFTLHFMWKTSEQSSYKNNY